MSMRRRNRPSPHTFAGEAERAAAAGGGSPEIGGRLEPETMVLANRLLCVGCWGPTRGLRLQQLFIILSRRVFNSCRLYVSCQDATAFYFVLWPRGRGLYIEQHIHGLRVNPKNNTIITSTHHHDHDHGHETMTHNNTHIHT